MNLPEGLQPLGGPVLQAQILLQAIYGGNSLRHPAVSFQPGGNAVIGELGLIADQGPVEFRIQEGPVAADHHFDDQGRPIFVEV